MKIKNIKIQNFKSLYGTHEFDFESLEGLVKLSGAIGSGKTSLGEAIIYGLYGTVKTHKNPNLIAWNTKSCCVEINLISKNKEIRIVRDILKPLEVYVNGKILGASNKRDTQSILEEEIYDVPKLAIERMCIISFNQFNSLASMNPGQTKEFLDNIFGFKTFTEYNDAVVIERKQQQMIVSSVNYLYNDSSIFNNFPLPIGVIIQPFEYDSLKTLRIDQEPVCCEYCDAIASSISEFETNGCWRCAFCKTKSSNPYKNERIRVKTEIQDEEQYKEKIENISLENEKKDEDITKEEFAIFKLDYKIYQIGFYSFASDELNPKRQKLHENEKHILSVFHENDTIMQDGDILFYDEFTNECNYDYNFFKEKYQETLDSLGYSTLFDVCLCGGYDENLSDDEMDERSEYASYQMSYGLTLDGREYLDLSMDKLGLYLRLYQFAF